MTGTFSTRPGVTGPAPGPRKSRGQSLVEFALVLPVFLVMLFGLLDAGRYVYMNSVLSQAAREGARLAAVEAYWIGRTDLSCGAVAGPVCPADETAFKADIRAAANRMVAPFGSISDSQVFFSCDPVGHVYTAGWTTTSCPAASRGFRSNVVSVRVVLTFTPITPVLSGIGTITTSGSAAMVIN
jgi:Flp pilus assembly protein TadG